MSDPATDYWEPLLDVRIIELPTGKYTVACYTQGAVLRGISSCVTLPAALKEADRYFMEGV